jgi:hypothetical protein
MKRLGFVFTYRNDKLYACEKPEIVARKRYYLQHIQKFRANYVWAQIKHYVKGHNRTFLLKSVKQLVCDAFEAIEEKDPNIWSKCVEHVKNFEQEYTKTMTATEHDYDFSDGRYVVNLESDADDEVSSTE